MDRSKQAVLKREYKETRQLPGVYAIRNEKTGRFFVGSSRNVNARINRHKASLSFGSEEISELMSDWKEYGRDSFTFEVLETLDGEYESDKELSDELSLLEQMWTEKYAQGGGGSYPNPVFRPGGVVK